MQKLLTSSRIKFVLAWLILLSSSAFAYVGPGAGITMLGSLWGLIIAIVFVVFGLLILPFKIMRNRMKRNKSDALADDTEEQKEADPATPVELRTDADSD